MSGLPHFGFDIFDEAAADLRSRGLEIVSPAELDDPKTREMAFASPDGSGVNKQTWGEFLSRDIQLVIDEVDGMILLPNWKESKGALIEAFTAYICGKPIFRYIEGSDPAPIDQLTLKLAWFRYGDQ